MMRFALGSTLAVLLVLAAGCGVSRETAEVTGRPAPPDTVMAQDTTGQATMPSEIPVPAGYDTVQARRFDQGKMWTFEDPPGTYFEDAYDFDPDSAWFDRAQRGALRFADRCSASFVSPHGLVLTNHHCARESVTKVSRPNENLLENGFFADSLAAERKVKKLYVEQLVAIEDVTERITKRAERLAGDEKRSQVIQQQIERVEERLTEQAKKRDEQLRVKVAALYSGGRYSAYTYRRYEDVRLVFAPELRTAFFGGEADNFTYPRYALDMALFRVYDEDGEPLEPAHYFEWDEEGAQEGEPVFVVGNPGSTSRLSTVSQLEYERDYAVPQQIEALRTRAELLQEYISARPDSAEQYDLRNTLFSIRNSLKAQTGQLEGLRDPYLLARRAAAERQLARQISEVDSLRQRYGGIIKQMQAVQRSKEAVADQTGAFTFFGAPSRSSHVLTRALYGYYYSLSRQRGAPPEQLQEIRNQALEVTDWPAELEADLIAARLQMLRQHLGENDPTVESLLEGRSPEQVARRLVENTALTDSTAFARMLEKGYLKSGDPTVPFIKALAPLYFTLGRQTSELRARENRLEARLARARLALYDTRVPPDANFSLRIADGRVKGYEYNGTRAPAHTTFWGMYNHHYTYGPDSDWGLPALWLSPPGVFTRSKALNLVSTNDITGGNSGSPLVDRDLNLVGVTFDSNIEALPNEYLYTTKAARAISVDSRGMLEALDDLYGADRLVRELVSGRLLPVEPQGEPDVAE